MTPLEEAERRGWARGYRCALDDLEAIGRSRLEGVWERVIEDLRADVREIDAAGKRKAILQRLKERQRQPVLELGE